MNKRYGDIFHSDWDNDWGAKWFKWNFFGVIIAFVFVAVMSDKIEHDYKTYKSVQYKENLSDNSEISGSFFLGSGTIKDEWVYSFYVKKGNAFYIKSIKAKNIPIVYSDDRPRVVTLRTKDETVNPWIFNHIEKKSTTIYVPRGSIKSNFNLDASK